MASAIIVPQRMHQTHLAKRDDHSVSHIRRLLHVIAGVPIATRDDDDDDEAAAETPAANATDAGAAGAAPAACNATAPAASSAAPAEEDD
ncbi:hypothetical protein GQ53DRAFT_831528 [Thozetella sp. PMI_491]|nr:hypothetical protein GQ53DRAFT_831528 [Thozetella sp. PMI_491]